MSVRSTIRLSAVALAIQLLAGTAFAQGSRADYERAEQLPDRLRNKTVMDQCLPYWVPSGEALWYLREDRPGDYGRWMRVDAATGAQRPAFDPQAFARALTRAARKPFNADRLRLVNLRIAEDERSFRFEVMSGADGEWVCDLDRYDIQQYVKPADDPGQRAEDGERSGGGRPLFSRSRNSPDGQWRARIEDHNVVLYVRDEPDEPGIILTFDGEAGDGYRGDFYWSPDAKHVVVVKRKAGDERRVTIIDSAPDDQLQPSTRTYDYLKPGDQVPVDRPRLFSVERLEEITVDDTLAPNPYRVQNIRWKSDSSAFTYEYNQRGHQAYRVIEVNAQTGKNRVIIDEAPETFFTYSSKKYLRYLDDTNELIWMSERDGWNHLYLIDWQTGAVKNQITRGAWVVRHPHRLADGSREIHFWAGGIHAGQDPYHLHYCKADLDTGQVTPLTASDGHHTGLSVSPDGKYLVTTWSRIDHAPVHELRNAETGELIAELARADDSKLVDAGWARPERFVAKGRDGQTDIHGIILKPTNFDPNKTYPVIENIYAGPHDQHVPKRFYEVMRTQQLAELGFIVVRIDGMGTNWRSKAFHDLAWKNLKDAGFPDRIAWMRAAAETRSWMDLSRVGIYGGSAGGQNAMRAVLDHHDLYRAAVADCGCHDNRMDKIWWNEQWMGYPVDQSYIDSSNTVDAHKLGGALLLTVGELDTNVDPASTMQVVDELIKHNKDFELMVFPGRGHGAGDSPFGVRLRNDFFVRHLMGQTPRWE